MNKIFGLIIALFLITNTNANTSQHEVLVDEVGTFLIDVENYQLCILDIKKDKKYNYIVIEENGVVIFSIPKLKCEIYFIRETNDVNYQIYY